MDKDPSSDTAVIFSGWLGVTVPQDRGRAIRANLIDVLRADVIIAGTYLEEDCPGDASCALLWMRLAALSPFAATLIEPMPSREWLSDMMDKYMPMWPTVKAAFERNVNRTYAGLNLFSPLIGNQVANVIREMVSYERAYTLMRSLELRRKRAYEFVVFSRLEFVWLAPHPPMTAFFASDDGARTVWGPPPDAGGMSDRHGVMRREAAPAYFRRLHALYAPDLLQRFALDELVTMGPEGFLRENLVRGSHFLHERSHAGSPEPSPRFACGEFPLTAFLACCDTHQQRHCWNPTCEALHLIDPESTRLQQPLPHSTPQSSPQSSPQPSPPAAQVRGKYRIEMEFAVTAWRWLQCTGGGYQHGTRIVADPMTPEDWHMQLVVPAGLELGDAHNSAQAYPPFVLINRSSPAGASMDRRAGCPLSLSASLLSSNMVQSGSCATSRVRDGAAACETKQRSLLDCAHACSRCAACGAFTFSQQNNDACTLHRRACAPSELLPPAEPTGWDVVHVSRSQAGALLDAASPGLRKLPPPRLGHCGVTSDGDVGDCANGAQGSLVVSANAFEVTDEVSCAHFCTTLCARCRFISFSLRARDCSWYASCDMSSLHQDSTWLKHKTYALGLTSR